MAEYLYWETSRWGSDILADVFGCSSGVYGEARAISRAARGARCLPHHSLATATSARINNVEGFWAAAQVVAVVFGDTFVVLCVVMV